MIWRYPHDLGDLQMDTPILYKWDYNGSIRVFEWNMNGINEWNMGGLDEILRSAKSVYPLASSTEINGITTYAWNIKILIYQLH
jgi:hypothetical protein